MASLDLFGVSDECTQTFDDKILKEYQQSSQLLLTQNNAKKLIKKNLMLLNEQNQIMTESLIQKKKDCENLKSDLNRKLNFIKITIDRDKILMRKKFDEYFLRKHNTQDYKKSPLVLELEDLIKTNKSLLEECMRVSDLLEATKCQYNEMVEYLNRNFKIKVCEFCDIYLKINALDKNY